MQNSLDAADGTIIIKNGTNVSFNAGSSIKHTKFIMSDITDTSTILHFECSDDTIVRIESERNQGHITVGGALHILLETVL